MLDAVFDIISKHEPGNKEYLNQATKELNKMMDMLETPNFQFIQAQLKMLLTSKNNLRYSKHLLVMAAELLCVLPAAYSMQINFSVICFKLLNPLWKAVDALYL